MNKLTLVILAAVIVPVAFFLYPRFNTSRMVIRIDCNKISYKQYTDSPAGIGVCTRLRPDGSETIANYGCGLLVERPESQWDIVLCHKKDNMVTLLLNGNYVDFDSYFDL